MTPPAPDPEDERLRLEARDREIDRMLADRRAGFERRQDPAAPIEMPGGIWLFNELTDLRRVITDQHSRLRADMNVGFAHVSEQLQAHELEDREVATRVALLEDREKRAREEAVRRTLTLSSLVAAIVGPGAAVLYKRWFGGP